MKDVQTGINRILKPARNFEDLFAGTRAVAFGTELSEMIPFFEWSDRNPPNPRDPLAGTTGYDPNLLNYINVRKGALCRLYFPYIPTSPDVVAFYRYFISFRDSNLNRYKQLGQRTSGATYSVPYESPGQPDSTVIPPAERFVIPAGVSTVAIHQPEPVFVGTADQSNELRARTECIVVRPSPIRPLIIGPGPVYGVHQQGMTNPADDPLPPEIPVAGSAGGLYYEFVAQGDEMLVQADRERPVDGSAPTGIENWDFTGIDTFFSRYYGKNVPGPVRPPLPELGLHLTVTSSP